MPYPTPTQYTEALQHPRTALFDLELKQGTVSLTPYGVPRPICGNFAVAYTVQVGSTKHAVRCFYRQSDKLEQRYSAISRKLKSLGGPYFAEFEFQPHGVRVGAESYPIVKMAWVEGQTLGTFVEERRGNKSELQRLRASMLRLATDLKTYGIAHGDISADNLMVNLGGRSLRLIDYDGMFVEELRSLGSSELGQRHFQHPGRNQQCWDAGLDQFSFIELYVALLALEADPGIWDDTDSGDFIVFNARDLADPSNSDTFKALMGVAGVAEEAERFAEVCKDPYDSIPSLEEFLAEASKPPARVDLPEPMRGLKYSSDVPVIDASDFAACLKHVDQRVELVGKVDEVRNVHSSDGDHYVFVSFGNWRDDHVQLNIWSQGLVATVKSPAVSWKGEWVSTVGVLRSGKSGDHTNLSVTITDLRQVKKIGQVEAEHRLGSWAVPEPVKASSRTGPVKAPTRNRAIVEAMKSARPNA